MTADLTYFRDDAEDGEAVLGRRGRCVPSIETLPLFALEEAIPASDRRRIARAKSFALVIEVPSAEWVEPIRSACLTLGNWPTIYARTGAARSEDRSDRGNDTAARRLAEGGRVLGVGQACERHLPSALVAAADGRYRVPVPSNAVIARVIRAATGQRPPAMPASVAVGLGIWDLCAAIRAGSARACVERLAAASEARSTVDGQVADAVPFPALCGYGRSHAWGMRLLEELEAWREGRIGSFADIDRNVVLASNPGLGKSTYVRSLAKSARLPLLVSSVSSWFSQSNGYLDGVVKHIDSTFEEAYARDPSLLFLDEIDSIPSRSSMDGRNSSWWTPVVTHMLLKIDECCAREGAGVCIIGATNYPDKLDPALVRPGRLGQVIRIAPPAAPDLAAIVRQHLGADLPDLDLTVVAELGLGASGAQVVGWVKAARARARAERRPIEADDLLEAVAPPDTRTAGEKMRSALHEAGHAVGAELLQIGHVAQVDLILRETAAGGTSMRSRLGPIPTRDDLERMVIGLLCGRAAETVFLGEASAGSGGDETSDLARATAFVAGIHGSFGLGGSIVYRGPMEDVARALGAEPALRAAVEADLARLQAEAERLISDYHDVVQGVAEALLDRRVLGGDALRRFIADARPRPARQAGGGDR
ncbi:ATP-dependent zinc metalloprotease FtsH [Methylobacterium brachiatum]|nr:ATP-dependent zinc metalloprotease FtsH [Methylobacterium brachiatum]